MQITLQEIKDYLRVDDTSDDNIIETIRKSAISYCETKLNRPILDEHMTLENTWEVAEEIRIAIYMLVTHWYENRNPLGQLSTELAFSISAILGPHRFINV